VVRGVDEVVINTGPDGRAVGVLEQQIDIAGVPAWMAGSITVMVSFRLGVGYTVGSRWCRNVDGWIGGDPPVDCAFLSTVGSSLNGKGSAPRPPRAGVS